MDLLFVVGALMGLDGLALPPDTVTAALEAECRAGVTIACDASWHSPEGKVDVAALQAAARPGCDAGDPVACAALGMGGVYSSVGVITGWTPGFAEAKGALTRACDAGVLRACTEVARLGLYAEAQTEAGAGPSAPLIAMADLCAEGEITACLWEGRFRAWGVGGKEDHAVAKATWAKACEGGHPVACAGLREAPADLEALCVQGAVSACQSLPDEYRAHEAVAATLARSCAAGRIEDCAPLPSTAPGIDRLERALLACEQRLSGCVDVSRVLRGPTPAVDEAALRDACAGGRGAACHGLGWLRLREIKDRTDLPAVAARFRWGCDAGFAPSCRELAALQVERLAEGAMPDQALAVLETGCGRGSARACELLTNLAHDREQVARSKVFESAGASVGGFPFLQAWLTTTGAEGVESTRPVPRKRIRPEYPDLAKPLARRLSTCAVVVELDPRGTPTASAAHGCHPYYLAATEELGLSWRFEPLTDTNENAYDLTIVYALEGAALAAPIGAAGY